MTCCTQLLTVVAELSRAAQQVDGAQVEALAEEILRAKRVFVAGAGRSGLCVRAFANRLMHLGICVYVVGETVTPPLTKDDLLLIGSGSGKTSGLVVLAEKAAAIGAYLATVTLAPQNPIGALCRVKVVLPGTTRLLADEARPGVSTQPMGSLFEQLSFLVYDALVLRLMEITGKKPEDLVCRHGNLE